MKIKYLDARERPELERYTYKIKYTDKMMGGYVSVIEIHEVKAKLIIKRGEENVCISDAGYKNVIFLPDKEDWCVTAIYDKDNKLIQYYFDIIREKAVNEKEIPFFKDMYLDVVVTNDFAIHILDEDELKDALNTNLISRSEYAKVYSIQARITKEIIKDIRFMKDFLSSMIGVV